MLPPLFFLVGSGAGGIEENTGVNEAHLVDGPPLG
jgi:hypothetical protein